MKASDYVMSILEEREELGNLTVLDYYHTRIYDLYSDYVDCIEEGYEEDLEVSQLSEFDYQNKRFTVTCDDGFVTVKLVNGSIKVSWSRN